MENTSYKVQSKQVYKTEKGALKASEKHPNGIQESRQLESGNWVFLIDTLLK